MALLKKILIANRGEIAIRVTRACRELGIGSVAVFSDADRDSLHVFLADEAYHIGPSPSKESYLNYKKIIEVAKAAGVDAVHPGYGFLSENTTFAKALEEAGITFIGPTVQNIESMGDKLSAKALMTKAGVPTVPGSDGGVETVEEAEKIATRIGLPIIIKASAGGGGKGMRVVRKMDELESAFRACRSEGQNYFANPTVYIEKFINDPKHIEIQIFGDKHGNHVHLFERECSVQRRHQKIIEESPSPSVPQEVRLRMGEASVAAAKQINYVGAGTIEFIFDNTTKEFYFMEMNTRLQVEHPITEIVTGYDLVKEQIHVAAGKPLSFKQSEIKQKGHAIETRICAEDPITYKPHPGVIRACRHPQGPFMRVDSYAYPGYEVPIYYDPMIAKLITWGETRNEAIERMQRALSEFVLTGIKTNIVLHKTILDHPTFRDGSYTTQFIEKNFEVLEPKLFAEVEDPVFLIAAAITAYNDRKSKDVRQLNLTSTWRRVGRKSSVKDLVMYFEAELKDKKYKVDVTEHKNSWKLSLQEEGKEWVHYDISKRDYKQAEQYISFLFHGKSYLIDVIGQDTEYTVFTRNSFRAIKVFNDEMLLHESLKKGGGFGGDNELKSGMPGKIIEIFAKEGDIVKANKPLLIMEAMKMENEMRASRDVKIKEIRVKQGDSVESGAVLIKFEDV